MAIGTYGTIRPADVSPADVEIIMNYTPSRDATDEFILKKLDSQTLLKPYYANAETGGNAGCGLPGFPRRSSANSAQGFQCPY